MTFKAGMILPNQEKLGFNSVVFATRDEADRAGRELFMRWMGCNGYMVVEVDDAVNYEFPVDAARPEPVEEE